MSKSIVSFRFESALLEKIDNWAAANSKPGMEISRSTAVRVLLLQALERWEKEKPVQSARPSQVKPDRSPGDLS